MAYIALTQILLAKTKSRGCAHLQGSLGNVVKLCDQEEKGRGLRRISQSVLRCDYKLKNCYCGMILSIYLRARGLKLMAS